MLTSRRYNTAVSETRAYNNDNTLASINFTRATRSGNLSYHWEREQKQNERDHRHDGVTGSMSAPAATTTGSPRRVESATTITRPSLESVTRRRLDSVDARRERPVPHPRPDARTAHRRTPSDQRGSRRHGQPNDPACDSTPRSDPLARMGFWRKADLSGHRHRRGC